MAFAFRLSREKGFLPLDQIHGAPKFQEIWARKASLCNDPAGSLGSFEPLWLFNFIQIPLSDLLLLNAPGRWQKSEQAGCCQLNRKVLEMAQANVDAAFEYAQDVVGVRSLSEFVDISTQYAQNQSAAMTEQTRDLATRAQKLAADTAQPLAGVTGLFKQAG